MAKPVIRKPSAPAKPPAPPKKPLRAPFVLHSREEFLRDLAGVVGFAVAALVLFLGIGILGYHLIVGLGWIDSLLNASMILTGMGPVDRMGTQGAKVFASLYAIIGGAVYPALTALVLYPIVHRMMKTLHIQALSATSGPAEDDE